MNTPQRILVVAPHTDDAELGCGGSMARWLEEGAEIVVTAFSTAEASLPEDSKPYRLKDECHAALDVLGVPEDHRFIYDFPVRELTYHRQAVLELLVQHGRDFNPDWVVVPSGADLHQDHHVAYEEALRAFKHKTLLGYELPWNHITFSASAFVALEQRHLDKKWEAMTRYTSQIELARPYFTPDFVTSMARMRGIQIKTALAEAFELIRIVL